jgi:hypothetical protein
MPRNSCSHSMAEGDGLREGVDVVVVTVGLKGDGSKLAASRMSSGWLVCGVRAAGRSAPVMRTCFHSIVRIADSSIWSSLQL